ncbi:hypothetical protein [Microbacterium rhizophilus]|uniref:hypothetical protein n=1 Tax=Microbacterium rhizophilus TaxID=3138934 RepID=UPI0031E65A69
MVVTLGPRAAAAEWHQIEQVSDIVTLDRARPDGRRLGSRALGLGADAVFVTAKSLFHRRTDLTLATNPWIGVALRAIRRGPLVVTGLYAASGTRQWEMLRNILRRTPVITWTGVEAEAWAAEGGIATFTHYGNTFPYDFAPLRKPSEQRRIFIGGSSDRDGALIDHLITEVLNSPLPTRLDIAVGTEPGEMARGRNSVVSHGRLPQEQFGRLLGAADVAYLPLVEGGRAAGHMLTVGALQLGIPVVASLNVGMSEYIDGTYVRWADSDRDILEQLVHVIDEKHNRSAIRAYWEKHYSRRALMSRLAVILNELLPDASPARGSEDA